MNFYIKDKIEGKDFAAQVVLLDATYKYFQITPEAGFPFFIKYDHFDKKWIAAAEIYKTNPKVIELVGAWISEKIKDDQFLTSVSLSA